MIQSSPFGNNKDSFFLKKALKQAQRALSYNEVPVGAVVVNPQGVIIARAYNSVEKKQSQSAHAEIQAIEKAGKKWHDWRLQGCWLYVTLEPCAMCMNLIKLSRLEGVLFGASSPLFGYQLDNANGSPLYKKNTVRIIGPVSAEESAHLLKRFFKEKRKQKSE